MTTGPDYSDYPDIHKYAQLEGLAPSVLAEAYRLEEKYHKLLLNEADPEKRVGLYDEFYATLIPLYDRESVQGLDHYGKDKYVKLFAPELEGRSIIDYGCGNGQMLLAIDRLLSTRSLTGIDVVFPKELKAHERINFVEGNLMTKVFDKPFEVAFSDNVLEHLVPDDAQMHLNNIYQNLTDNGKLIIIMPNRLFGPWDITRIKDFSQSGKTEAMGGHVNESTHYEMIECLRKAGFKDFSTILPTPKLKYLLFNKLRTKTGWMERLEKSSALLKLIKAFRYKGVSVLSFPVMLIATK